MVSAQTRFPNQVQDAQLNLNFRETTNIVQYKHAPDTAWNTYSLFF